MSYGTSISAILSSGEGIYIGGIRPRGDGTCAFFNTACARRMGFRIPSVLSDVWRRVVGELTRHGADTSKPTTITHD